MNDKFNKFSFKHYDIYSKRIGFFYNNHEKIGSYFSLFLTVSYIIITLILFIFLLVRTIQRKEMKVYDSTIYSKDIPIIDINSNLIYFAFGLEDPITANRFVDETIYNVKIAYFDRIKINGQFQTIERRDLDYELCKEEKFGENYKNLFMEGELNNSYCLKDYNLTLAGGYKYNRMSYFRIRLYPCINSTTNKNHCKPQSIIDTYFKNGYFSILSKDIGLNPSNYSFPVLPTLQDLYTSIDKNIYRDYILYYGITEIQTDTGLFLEYIENKRYLDFRKEGVSFNFRDEKDFYSGKTICSIAFRLDDIIKVQKRTYTKFKEVFASTGGYMQLISTIFTLLSLISNKLIPELKIMNGIFNFSLKNQKMMMKINTIKDFNSAIDQSNFNNYIYFPSKKSIFQGKKNSVNINNLSKGSLIGLDDNNSSLINVFNNKEELFNKKRESGKQNNITKENSKISSFVEQKFKAKRDKKDGQNKSNKSNNFLDFNEIIHFNLFDYYCYCFRSISEKNSEIKLFNSGITLYKRKMDIINVFTFLILIEKFIAESHDIIALYKDL